MNGLSKISLLPHPPFRFNIVDEKQIMWIFDSVLDMKIEIFLSALPKITLTGNKSDFINRIAGYSRKISTRELAILH